jgi:hypothetical protein
MDTPENVAVLTIKGVRSRVEVSGIHGISYRVLLGGEPLKQVKGRWLLPAAGGKTVVLRQRGFLPGFQKLVADDEVVYQLGAYVPVWLRVLMFLPFVLIAVNPLFGIVLAILLFFMNVMVVKNPQMPIVLRAILPVVNTVAAGIILLILANAASGSA